MTCPKPLMLLVAEFVFPLLPSLWLLIFCMLSLSLMSSKREAICDHITELVFSGLLPSALTLAFYLFFVL